MAVEERCRILFDEVRINRSDKCVSGLTSPMSINGIIEFRDDGRG